MPFHMAPVPIRRILEKGVLSARIDRYGAPESDEVSWVVVVLDVDKALIGLGFVAGTCAQLGGIVSEQKIQCSTGRPVREVFDQGGLFVREVVAYLPGDRRDYPDDVSRMRVADRVVTLWLPRGDTAEVMNLKEHVVLGLRIDACHDGRGGVQCHGSHVITFIAARVCRFGEYLAAVGVGYQVDVVLDRSAVRQSRRYMSGGSVQMTKRRRVRLHRTRSGRVRRSGKVLSDNEEGSWLGTPVVHSRLRLTISGNRSGGEAQCAGKYLVDGKELELQRGDYAEPGDAVGCVFHTAG